METDARIHFPQMAFLALKQSKNLRSRRQSLGYAAQLFNYAAFQINYVRLSCFPIGKVAMKVAMKKVAMK